MKTIIAFTLLLLMTAGSLGYFEYREYAQVMDLQFQVSSLQTRIDKQDVVISVQQKTITRDERRAGIVENALVKVVEFINALTEESQPETKHQSLPSS